MAIPKRDKKTADQTVQNAPEVTEEVKAPSGVADMPIVPEPPPQAELPDNSAPIAVPAEPTPEQVWARDMRVHMHETFLAAYALRPMASTWVEPDAQQRKNMIRALASERNIDPLDDPEGFAGIVKTITTQIDEARKASGQDKQQIIDRDYLIAARAAVKELHDAINTMLASHKVKASSVATTGEKKTRTTSATKDNWAKIAPAAIAWAKEHGLEDFVLVDNASKGYEGTFHAVRLHSDGQWEKLEYHAEKRSYRVTGEMVDKPVWFTNSKGERPKYSAGQMFGVLLISPSTGKRVELDDESIYQTGVKEHLGDLDALLDSISE